MKWGTAFALAMFVCNTLTVQGISPSEASSTGYGKNTTTCLPSVKSLPRGFPSLTPLGVASKLSFLCRVKEEAPGPESRGSQTHEEANTTRCPFQAGQKPHRVESGHTSGRLLGVASMESEAGTNLQLLLRGSPKPPGAAAAHFRACQSGPLCSRALLRGRQHL